MYFEVSPDVLLFRTLILLLTAVHIFDSVFRPSYVLVLYRRKKWTGYKSEYGHQSSPEINDTWRFNSTHSLRLQSVFYRHSEHSTFTLSLTCTRYLTCSQSQSCSSRQQT